MRTPMLTSAALSLCLFATPAPADERHDLPLLLNAIGLWLEARFGLPAAPAAPGVVSAPLAKLVAMRYGPDADVRPGDVVAIYDDASRVIHISEGWTGRTPAELSVLVHEMVHHLQSAASLRFACPAEREILAYRAQDAWLGLFGMSLESAFGIDSATLLVGTVCTH